MSRIKRCGIAQLHGNGLRFGGVKGPGTERAEGGPDPLHFGTA